MDVSKLATLARIELSQEEKAGFEKDFEGILAYMDQIKQANADDVTVEQTRINIFREDSNANTSGACTEELLSSAPDREGDYLKVKKIL